MLYYARSAVREATTFLESVVFRAFFADKKWWAISYGGFVLFLLTMSWNVWTTLSLAQTMNVVGDMFQHKVRQIEFDEVLRQFAFYGFSYWATEVLIEQYQLRYGWYWREAITRALFPRWTEALSHIEGASERIADCPRDLAQKIVDLSIPVVRSIMVLCVFVPVLWDLSKRFPLADRIPGLLVWFVVLWCATELLASLIIGRRLPGLRFGLRRKEAELRTNFEDLERTKKTKASLCVGEIRTHMNSLDERLLRLRASYSEAFLHLLFLGVWKNTYRQTWGFGTMIAGISLVARNLISAGVYLETSNILNETHRAFSVVSDSWGIVTEIVGILRRLREFEALTLTRGVVYVEYEDGYEK
ncbi:MAG: SbmA/BacA-like family transporter [Candidatus Pacebacteria bacterium]|nr:SbmA/BacA-like family transporter [Candidatus Paceibacterota bacterium]